MSYSYAITGRAHQPQTLGHPFPGPLPRQATRGSTDDTDRDATMTPLSGRKGKSVFERSIDTALRVGYRTPGIGLSQPAPAARICAPTGIVHHGEVRQGRWPSGLPLRKYPPYAWQANHRPRPSAPSPNGGYASAGTLMRLFAFEAPPPLMELGVIRPWSSVCADIAPVDRRWRLDRGR